MARDKFNRHSNSGIKGTRYADRFRIILANFFSTYSEELPVSVFSPFFYPSTPRVSLSYKFPHSCILFDLLTTLLHLFPFKRLKLLPCWTYPGRIFYEIS